MSTHRHIKASDGVVLVVCCKTWWIAVASVATVCCLFTIEPTYALTVEIVAQFSYITIAFARKTWQLDRRVISLPEA